MFVLRRLRFALDRVLAVFEEPEVARYVTVAGTAGGFTVPDPGAGLPLSDRHFQGIDAPGLVAGPQPVIFFRTHHSGTPSFSVRLNATRLAQFTFGPHSPAGPNGWHEIIPAGALKPAANELTFAVSGDGAVQFGDVVILYTSNRLTVRRRLEPVLDPG